MILDYVLDGGMKPALHGRHRTILAAVPAEASVLDIGAGRGQLAKALVGKGCDYVGLEIRPDFLTECQGLGLDVRLANIDDYLDQPNLNVIVTKPYDVVIFSKVLILLHRKNELIRDLRTNRIIINGPNLSYWRRRFGLSPIPEPDVPYRCANGDEVSGKIDGLRRWGSSYGYSLRRLSGGGFNGRDMVIVLNR